MIQQDLKNYIRSWVKNNKVVSELGEISVEKLLGEGGNALVFLTPFAGGTAIKFLAEPVSFPPSTRFARFLDEYRNLVKLVPTGAIVPLYHFGVQTMDGERIPYIVMERCEKTLYEAYKNTKLLKLDDFEKLLERLLRILHILHNSNIVHRDIKPQNILLRPNGRWVLGDFGIAWFDPDVHQKLVSTDKNERLANFEFSAPEQIKRRAYDKATPSMDLYALGQTLYYCVTGQVIRGSLYPHFDQIVPELSKYDSLIEKLVRQIPQERFQSVDEVYQFQEEQKRQVKGANLSSRWVDLSITFRKNLDAFDAALRRAVPGSYGYVQTKDRVVLNRVLSSLATYRDACDLWWFRGHLNHPIEDLRQFSENIWLIDNLECEITEICVYRSRNDTRDVYQYIALHLAPRSQFGIYEMNENAKYEEAGYYNGKYVTREEFDDGYALINEEVVALKGAELRERNLKDDFLLLAPKASVFNQSKNDRQCEKVYQELISKGKIESSILKNLSLLEKPKWIEYDPFI